MMALGGLITGETIRRTGQFFCGISQEPDPYVPGALLCGTGSGLIGTSVALLAGCSPYYAVITGIAVGIFTTLRSMDAMRRF